MAFLGRPVMLKLTPPPTILVSIMIFESEDYHQEASEA
jgi:hypothetical protein